MKKSLHDEIAQVAYALYEKKGSLPGNSFADWFEAENIVMNKQEKHAHEIEKRAEPVNKPAPGFRRTVKKEGLHKKS